MIAILADAFVKATILLLVAAGGTLLLRRSSAALRHLVWALACAGVLVLPVASALLPNWRVAAWPSLGMAPAFDVTQTAGPSLVDRQAPRHPATPAAQPEVRDSRPAARQTANPSVSAWRLIGRRWSSRSG